MQHAFSPGLDNGCDDNARSHIRLVPPTLEQELRARRAALQGRLRWAVAPSADERLSLAVQRGELSSETRDVLRQLLLVIGVATVYAGTPGSMTMAQLVAEMERPRMTRVRDSAGLWRVHYRGATTRATLYRRVARLVALGCLTRGGGAIALADAPAALGDLQAHAEVTSLSAELRRLGKRDCDRRRRARQAVSPVRRDSSGDARKQATISGCGREELKDSTQETPLPVPEKFEDAFAFDALRHAADRQQAVASAALPAPTQDEAGSPATGLAPTSALEMVQGLVPKGVPERAKERPEARQAAGGKVAPPVPAIAAPGGQDAAEPAWLTEKRRALAARMAANDNENAERDAELAAEAERMAELTRVRPRPCPVSPPRRASPPRRPDGVRAEQGGGPEWRAKAPPDVDPKPATPAVWERMCEVHSWLGRSWWTMVASMRPSQGHLLRAVGILADARLEQTIASEPGYLKRTLANLQAGR